MKKEITVEEGNNLIARFLGYSFVTVGYVGCEDETIWQKNNEQWMEDNGMENVGDYFVNVQENKWFEVGDTAYHTSWDWLMPVVEKIDSLTIEGCMVCQTNATSHTFYINYNDGKVTYEQYPKYYNGRHRSENETRIENVWQAVVQFIQWYNTQTPTA